MMEDAMGKKELKVKLKGELEQAISHLESIVSSLKEKKLVIQKDEAYVVLTPEDFVSLEIKAEEKKDKQELSLEISWKTAEVMSEESPSNLNISSKEPEIKEEAAAEDSSEEPEKSSF